MPRLDWKKLLCEERRRVHPRGTGPGPQDTRTEMERDHDRILFAAPTRRLADKTQVFPMEPIDSVRTRLTHSHEVANLARSIGMSLAFDHPEVFDNQLGDTEMKRKVPAMLAAIGLVHDLGNPPFGHQGEKAMQAWFRSNSPAGKSKNSSSEDFKNFNGNPQSFRLLTRLQILDDDCGINLTYGTLAAMVKYPWFQSSKQCTKPDSKFGVFESEKKIIQKVWRKTGLREGVKHPFAYILDACDDIAYAVIDAEDVVKKGYASFYDLMYHLDEEDPVAERVMQKAQNENSKFKKSNKSEPLSSGELNEISMQMFRVFAISELIEAATKCFVGNIGKIMAGSISGSFGLIENSPANDFCESLKKFDRQHGFNKRQVLNLELRGHNYIVHTMDMLWKAISVRKETAFSKYANAVISENYRRIHGRSKMPAAYKNRQLLADFVAGMTDSFLIRIHNDLRPLHDRFVKGSASK